jgi:hypothetical protein
MVARGTEEEILLNHSKLLGKLDYFVWNGIHRFMHLANPIEHIKQKVDTNINDHL